METKFTTLEEAQAEIIRLQEELTERTTERDTLSQNNETLTADLEKSRNLNQRYFEKLCMQNSEPEGKNGGGEEEPLSCEEFARTLKI